MYAERAAEAPLHDERADDLREAAVEAGHLAHVFVEFGRAGVVACRVVNDEGALRLDEVAADGLVVADARRADAPAVEAGREVLVHDGRVVGALRVVGAYVDARRAERLAQLVCGGAQDFGQVERGAYPVAEAVDERLARRGRLGALVEFGLAHGDAGLVGDGEGERDVLGAPAPHVADGREGEAAGHFVAHAYRRVHDRARAESLEYVLVDGADGGV